MSTLHLAIDFMVERNLEYSSYKDFTTLEAWKKARTLKLFFYNEVIPVMPYEERYNLGTQMRRASVSVTANIAEGYGRYYHQESIRFYRVSRGSMYELKDHLTTSLDLNLINKDLFDKGTFLIEEAKKTLNGYIKFLQNNNKGRLRIS
jgi:four helix bundle protein